MQHLQKNWGGVVVMVNQESCAIGQTAAADFAASASLLQSAPAIGKTTGRKARLEPFYPEGTKGAGPLPAGPQHSVLLLLLDILQPGRVFRVAPMMDVNDVAVGVAQRETSARHVSRIDDCGRRDAVRQ